MRKFEDFAPFINIYNGILRRRGRKFWGISIPKGEKPRIRKKRANGKFSVSILTSEKTPNMKSLGKIYR